MVRRMQTRRQAILGALTLVLASRAARAGGRRPADELDIGISQYPGTFHPMVDPSVAASYVLGMARRPLTVFDAKWQVVAMLCTEVPTIENGRAVPFDLPDGKRGIRLTLSLHPGARWGDGVPVTTKDVLFTNEVGKNPLSGIADADLFRRIISIDVKDDKTFTVTLNKLTYDYSASLADFEVLPAHLERAAFSDPAQYHNRTLYDSDPANPGLYFGPYRITEVEAGSHIVLERNPTWWGKAPAFRRIVIWTIENSAALEANLLAGGIDMVAGEIGFTLDQALAFQKHHGDEYDITYKPTLIYSHIDCNLDHPILADQRVRQALMYGIDREAISQQLYDGRQIVADSFVPPLDWVYSKEVPHYAYDPAKARVLLEAAGWHAGGDTMRRNAAGHRLALDLSMGAGNHGLDLVAQVFQSQWREIGIEVHIKAETPRTLFGETMRNRKFDLAFYAWVSAPENDPLTTLRSDQVPSQANGFSGQNYPGFRDPEADRLVNAIEIELERPRRAEEWHELQALYAEQLPALPLFFRSNPFILPKWLKGVTPTGHQYPSTLWVEDWYVEARS
ncbi:MAG TPA: peptide ABC transporter substrate-binding protein [Stellaceae bacterium]|nr:peptide ABC transporter substrate-binding protein [Stellaceae bacterium]